MRRFSHAFVIAFEADSESENPDDVTTEELLAGLRRRASNLTANGNEIKEAVTSWGDDPVDRQIDAPPQPNDAGPGPEHTT